jgi:hypothetical protein
MPGRPGILYAAQTAQTSAQRRRIDPSQSASLRHAGSARKLVLRCAGSPAYQFTAQCVLLIKAHRQHSSAPHCHSQQTQFAGPGCNDEVQRRARRFRQLQPRAVLCAVRGCVLALLPGLLQRSRPISPTQARGVRDSDKDGRGGGGGGGRGRGRGRGGGRSPVPLACRGRKAILPQVTGEKRQVATPASLAL